MTATSNELLELAKACAARVDLPANLSRYPSFSEVEEQCEAEYEELLGVMHEDEVFEPVDLERQQRIVDELGAELTEDQKALLDELTDNYARHTWLQQEGAYYVGLALGLRAAANQRAARNV